MSWQMTKIDLVKAFKRECAKKHPKEWTFLQTTDEAEEIINIFLNTIKTALNLGVEKIEIRGFGTFRTKIRSPREIKIPNRKDKILLKPALITTFKPSKKLNRILWE